MYTTHDSTAMTSKLKLVGPRYSITVRWAEMDDTECQPPLRIHTKKRRTTSTTPKKKKKKILDDGDDDLETPFLKIDKCQRQPKEELLFKTIVLVFNTHTWCETMSFGT